MSYLKLISAGDTDQKLYTYCAKKNEQMAPKQKQQKS